MVWNCLLALTLYLHLSHNADNSLAGFSEEEMCTLLHQCSEDKASGSDEPFSHCKLKCRCWKSLRMAQICYYVFVWPRIWWVVSCCYAPALKANARWPTLGIRCYKLLPQTTEGYVLSERTEEVQVSCVSSLLSLVHWKEQKELFKLSLYESCRVKFHAVICVSFPTYLD